MIDEILINQWIEKGEGPTIDFKNSGILSHPDDLAKIMTAFANNKFICESHGGQILIGVDDNGDISGVDYKKGHEESIMNIARDKINPSIIPQFEKININEKTIYVVTIPKTTSQIHSLISKVGNVYLIRVGSTNRSANSNELERLMKTQEKSKEEIEEIKCIKRLDSETSDFYKKLTVTTMNVNSQLIEFSKDVFESSEVQRPHQHLHLGHPTMHQNEIRYSNRYQKSTLEPLGGFDNFGNFCFKENQDGDSDDVMKLHLGRCIFFILSTMDFIKNIYKKFGYSDNIQVNFDLSVKSQTWLDTIPEKSFIDIPRPFEGGIIRIQKITNVSTIDTIELTKSIIAEVLRSFGVPKSSRDMDSFVKYCMSKFSI